MTVIIAFAVPVFAGLIVVLVLLFRKLFKLITDIEDNITKEE